MELYLERIQGTFDLSHTLSEDEDSMGDYIVNGTILIGSFISLEDALCRAQADLDSGEYPGGLFLSGFGEEPQAEL